MKKYEFLTHLRLSQSIISPEFIDTIKLCRRRSLIHLEFYQCDLNKSHVEQLKELENQGHLFHLSISQQSWYASKSKTSK